MKEWYIGINIKQIVRLKIRQMSVNIFLNHTMEGVNLLFLLVYLKRDNEVKRSSAKRFYIPKGKLSRILTSSSV